MARLLLIHWNEPESAERAARLGRAGHDVRVHWSGNSEELRRVRRQPPDAVVIDLSRSPSQGRAVATWLRQARATRAVPLVFVGGDEAKVARVRAALPDAAYTTWPRIRGTLRRALARPPADPVVPSTMGAYSGTPLPKKLGIRPGSTVALVGAPADFERTLGELPDAARVTRRGTHPAQRVMLFARSRADLRRRFPGAVKRMAADGGGLWIAWPKKTSGQATDLGEAEVRRFGLAAGLVDYKICAIDDVWSGLLFARRRTGR